MDFAPFDKRGYPTVGVKDGYGEWAPTYEKTVLDLMDLALFARLKAVDWARCPQAADLACGTGRVGAWLKGRGVSSVHGVDLTPQMLAQAEAKAVYDRLALGDVAATGLETGAYALVTMSLADEHLPELGPVYRESFRLLRPGGRFVLAGYHPHFLMRGMPTHYDNAKGEPVAVESHVHLMSDHAAAAHGAGFTLSEMAESVIDDAWIAAKPKWEMHRGHPISFVFVWECP